MPHLSPIESWLYQQFGLFATGEDGRPPYTSVTGWLDEMGEHDPMMRGMYRECFASIAAGKNRARAELHEKMMKDRDRGAGADGA